MSFKRYIATIQLIIAEAANALKYLRDIQDEKIPLPNQLVKSRFEQVFAQFIAVKIYCLFDKTNGVISFEKIEKDWRNNLDKERMGAYKAAYIEIKTKYAKLITRIMNNRKIGIGHIQKKEELGWDKETVDKLNKWGSIMELDKIYTPTKYEYTFLSLNKFPFEEIKNLLKELENLIFYELLYHKTKTNKDGYDKRALRSN